MTKQIKADLMLLVVTLCWGLSYYLVDISLKFMEPFTLNAFRFIIAFMISGIFAFQKLRNISKATLKYSIILGIILVAIYASVTFGVKYTTLSNAGFLCALTVIFTPILSSIIYKKLPDKKLILVVMICFIGIALLTLKEGLLINFENIKGDLLCILCAFLYAFHLLITEKAVSYEDVSPFQMGVLQLGVTGTSNLILSLILESPQAPPNSNIWITVLFLSIFCTGLAFIVQSIAQKYTTASHVGVIFSLEPVFAGFVAFFLAGEVLTTKAYIGAALMVASVFIMEIDFSKLKAYKC